MSISSLRWRATLALGAAAAAVLALAVPAGASTGTPAVSPEQAGYTATGAQFRHVSASVYLRNPAQIRTLSTANPAATASTTAPSLFPLVPG